MYKTKYILLMPDNMFGKSKSLDYELKAKGNFLKNQ